MNESGILYITDKGAGTVHHCGNGILIPSPDADYLRKNRCEMFNPTGITIAPETGMICVTDSRGVVFIFRHDWDGKNIDKKGSGGGEKALKDPRCAVVLKDSTIAVGDFGHERIVIYHQKQHTVKDTIEGISCVGIGQLSNGQLVSLSSDGKVNLITGTNTKDMKLLAIVSSNPGHLVVDEKDQIFVCEAGKKRIAVINAETSKITYFGEGELEEPVGIAVDRQGKVYVADRKKNAVIVFE